MVVCLFLFFLVVEIEVEMRALLEALVDEMLNGQILLEEALSEFEKLYIQKALSRHKKHLSNTAKVLGIHRNTLSKRVGAYQQQERTVTRTARTVGR